MKQKKWPFFLIGFIFLIGVIGSFWVLQRPNTSQVEIVRDGEVLYQFDLARAEDQIIEIAYEGRVNTVEIRNHQIHMLDAQCPDKTCVQMGWLNSAAPIVCLPNHLAIQFVQGNDDLDATVG